MSSTELRGASSGRTPTSPRLEDSPPKWGGTSNAKVQSRPPWHQTRAPGPKMTNRAPDPAAPVGLPIPKLNGQGAGVQSCKEFSSGQVHARETDKHQVLGSPSQIACKETRGLHQWCCHSVTFGHINDIKPYGTAKSDHCVANLVTVQGPSRLRYIC
jgi:hypothetical protein